MKLPQNKNTIAVMHLRNLQTKKGFVFLLSVFFAIGLYSMSEAKVESGKCSNCHTMHNSQGGQPMAFQINPAFTGFESEDFPNPSLLVTNCVGCHSSSGTSTIEDGVPIVFNMNPPVDPLAGGNFCYVRSNNDNGHNVTGITDADTFTTIPGSTTAYYQLSCAGEFGCHGDRSIGHNALDAIRTAHHKDDSEGIDGSSVGRSYRFLDGILGTEDRDWEQDNLNTSHNEYKGDIDFSNTTAISSLCEQCHEDFHSITGVGIESPWLRHPTDIVLPSTGEYQYYNGGPGGTAAAPYSMIAPLARPNLATVADTSTINPGTDIVMCLSCHRAHGSPYYKLMRWDYKSDTLSEALSGCSICHTSKK